MFIRVGYHSHNNSSMVIIFDCTEAKTVEQKLWCGIGFSSATIVMKLF